MGVLCIPFVGISIVLHRSENPWENEAVFVVGFDPHHKNLRKVFNVVVLFLPSILDYLVIIGSIRILQRR